MTLHDAALTIGGMVAVGSTLLSAVMIWLMLTQPVAMTGAPGGPGAVSVVRTAVVMLRSTVREHLKQPSGDPQ